ncbi:caboxypeptidase 4 [Danaus plexippus plexippus]|uniref:Caboxypeptidase 4 n=1 Tax=Danaus plexippus plexippus TaxID=278856 RepID=A0A212FCG9_DANPL|nr:caboxypeptidase 4 [Danaus plexippus plexippus]
MKVWVFSCFIFAVSAKHEEFAGWKSYYVEPSDLGQLKSFNSLIQHIKVDVFAHPIVGRPGLILVDPSFQNELIGGLERLGIKYKIHAEDVKSQFDLEDDLFKNVYKKSPQSNFGGKLPYDSYQSYETINKYLDDIAKEYPEKAKVVTHTSFNGLPIKYLRVSTTNFEDPTKPIIYLDGGIHGREWLSIPPVTFAINRLLENGTDSSLLEKFDFILFPIVNTDGYQYSRDRSAAWRKTRSWYQDPWSIMCPGVDIDRNFDFHWNTTGAGSSKCSYVYPGVSAFSEAETRVVREILLENDRILMYISFSSGGSLIMYPWAVDGSLSSEVFRLHNVGVAMADTINALQMPEFFDYKVGNAALVRQLPMSGTSIDYAHHLGVPLTFTIELPGLFGGYFMNPIYMARICFETWEGVKAGIRKAEQLYM